VWRGHRGGAAHPVRGFRGALAPLHRVWGSALGKLFLTLLGW